jgi:hypothetical protein
VSAEDDLDYRDLLRRYIEHVRYCEGVDFLRLRDEGANIWTDAEWRALNALRSDD